MDFTYQVKRAAFREYAEIAFGWHEEAQVRIHAGRFQSQPFFIVSWNGEDVGMMSYEIKDRALHLYQIFLPPEFQRRGIGRLCMERLMSQGLPVRLRVLKVNPRARAFYERLGFDVVGDDGTHDVMLWDSVER